MAERKPPAPYGRKTQRPPVIPEMDVLWITAGLGCDGDTVSITAARQPSLEDLVLGAIPGIPKVNFHNPVLAYENGGDLLAYWHRAAEGKLDPFLLVVEGSIPNEKIKAEGIGRPSAPIRRRASQSRRVSGSIGWRLAPGL
jgi:hydrogenase small subunit